MPESPDSVVLCYSIIVIDTFITSTRANFSNIHGRTHAHCTSTTTGRRNSGPGRSCTIRSSLTTQVEMMLVFVTNGADKFMVLSHSSIFGNGVRSGNCCTRVAHPDRAIRIFTILMLSLLLEISLGFCFPVYKVMQ
ncbi:hypothetical protein C1H46_019139 [Malus baccata]|uniref:Uncharacterized protein n=1 Tax=Malus baccata TaxID=106549 RepID=A0A540M925_MALBA|nr:hypothetical protein C1H46_019139 [Malus baccata]